MSLMTKKHLALIILVIISFINIQAQISIGAVKGKKESYKVGDKIDLTIKLKTLPETCADGMSRVKIYVSGMEIETQTEWVQLKPGFWTKNIRVSMVQSKKNKGVITVMRRVDKENLFQQAEFLIQ